jgi:hypothetical protein
VQRDESTLGFKSVNLLLKAGDYTKHSNRVRIYIYGVLYYFNTYRWSSCILYLRSNFACPFGRGKVRGEAKSGSLLQQLSSTRRPYYARQEGTNTRGDCSESCSKPLGIQLLLIYLTHSITLACSLVLKLHVKTVLLSLRVREKMETPHALLYPALASLSALSSRTLMPFPM